MFLFLLPEKEAEGLRVRAEPGAESAQGKGLYEFHRPGTRALFAGGFNYALPALQSLGAVLFNIVFPLTAAAAERGEACDPEFCRLLHEKVHLGIFQHRLSQVEDRLVLLLIDVSCQDAGDNLSADIADFGQITQTGAVKELDLGAHMESQGLDDVPRFGLGKPDFVAISLIFCKKKSTHHIFCFITAFCMIRCIRGRKPKTSKKKTLPSAYNFRSRHQPKH